MVPKKNGDNFDVELDYKSTGKTRHVRIRIKRGVLKVINISLVGGVGFASFKLAERVLAWIMGGN